ncbi:fatty acid--CoA ligase family protein [Sediminibacterium sp.]|uniref:ANL family adenylate-forming protein n=1 Tax=Sediminibacterium sp. TaxID=1917865 RepID=UPI0025F55318|nr:fatty acid--CoA ligase family protein [Sediminibacterium sp.]MBW0177661.1 fatty acid--CoA ligase family protein [Sediminibacterium sp.]
MDNQNPIGFLEKVFIEEASKEAIIWNDQKFTYQWLNERVQFFKALLIEKNLPKTSVVVLKGDFTPESIALMLALISHKCIIVPLTKSVKNEEKLLTIAGVEYVFTIDENDSHSLKTIGTCEKNDLYREIENRDHPGLVLFSSGTSGEPKCAVHDFSKLLAKFHEKRKALRTLNFLMFDHWGGLNTMFHILSNGGVVISTHVRTPENICRLIEKNKIELLPASPTFLNLLLLSEIYAKFDLSSLTMISYGTEPMLPSTLQKLKNLFPNVRLLQTYGLIELGVLKSKSKSDDSLWVKLGGDGYQLRVVDGLLEIKAESAMLGYLNADSPFTEDGWFKTGDSVLVEGEYFKILGRKSELINVGGEKVYPTEIENVINEMDNVAEVMVYGERNPITGKIIVAKVRLSAEEDKKQFIARLKEHCKARLESFKVPVKVLVDNEIQYGDRLKKTRV